ncbi:MAG: ferrous iron transporter B [Clostridiales bacterium]|nr:ferrous iron transporter B [Clostridiales bacterium]
MKIAIAGNPNSGKTTLFNAITGKTEFVGNWPGVTVDKKEADIKKKYRLLDESIRIVDLPGAYSISPFTGEEVITRDYVIDEKPDVIINIVDGANLGRSLFFTTQLLELNVPMVIALNKKDIIERRKDEIDMKAFERVLKCPVIETVATSNVGLKELIQQAIKVKENHSQEKIEVTGNSDIDRQKVVDHLVSQIFIKKSDSSQIRISDRVDRIVAHKWLGIPIFFLIMWAVFSFSINGLGGFLSGYLNDTFFGELVPNFLNTTFEAWNLHPLLQALVVDGVIGGVGAVLGFLPLIMVLFFCLALLEDSGYMSRIAVVMDRFFKKIGLSGKSIIPMIVGSGCAIPGVMATRTIEDVNERRMTTILTPFVPCGAKLPIITLFTAVFFSEYTWVGPSMYVIAIAMIIIGGLLLKKIFVWEGNTGFILELPDYKVPSLKHATIQMFDKAKSFIKKATTIILVCNTVVWFAQTYSFAFKPIEDQSLSILAGIGGIIAPLLIPIGLVGWQMAAATITGFIAKENVVGTLAVILLASDELLYAVDGPLQLLFTPVTAFAFLVFNLFTPPCFAAIGAMNSELGSKKWLAKALGFQLGIGYMLALLITQIGTLIYTGSPAQGFVPAIIITVVVTVFVVYLIRTGDKKRANEKRVA